jgi:hypothetical protein
VGIAIQSVDGGESGNAAHDYAATPAAVR